ncbi:uncharacterized protein METZ01_LOCUS284806, partial [marine metagenome]
MVQLPEDSPHIIHIVDLPVEDGRNFPFQQHSYSNGQQIQEPLDIKNADRFHRQPILVQPSASLDRPSKRYRMPGPVVVGDPLFD